MKNRVLKSSVENDDPVSFASDEERFQVLLNDFQPALARLCRGYEADEECQRELFQDILLNLWRSFPSFRGECSTRSWVFRVAHNVSISHVRKARRRRPDVESLHHPGGVLDPSDGMNEAVDLKFLGACIQKLEPGERQMVMLYLEELSHAEISEILGLSLSNVSTRLNRVKSKLRLLMKGAR